MKPSCTHVALATLCMIFATGCSSDTPMVIEDEPGSVQVSVATTGVDLDDDGYTIAVGGSTMALAVDGSVTFAGLDAGSYTAALSGLAANCMVDGRRHEAGDGRIGPDRLRGLFGRVRTHPRPQYARRGK